jgi:hypothetical protein
VHTTLVVIYTERLLECAAFYRLLGMPLRSERHGNGPTHYAAELDGLVLELYPASARRPATGSLRLGFTSTADAFAPGRHLLTDPDGRTVDLHVTASA